MWDHLAEVIKAAGSGPLAFFALAILIMGYLARRWFDQHDDAKVRIAVLIIIILALGAVPFIIKLTSVPSKEAERGDIDALPSSNPASGATLNPNPDFPPAKPADGSPIDKVQLPDPSTSEQLVPKSDLHFPDSANFEVTICGKVDVNPKLLANYVSYNYGVLGFGTYQMTRELPQQNSSVVYTYLADRKDAQDISADLRKTFGLVTETIYNPNYLRSPLPGKFAIFIRGEGCELGSGSDTN